MISRRFVGGPGWAPFLGCPCGAQLKDHSFVNLATVPADSLQRERIDGWIDYHEWNRLPFASQVEGDDLIVFRALRCPAGGGAVVPLRLAATVMDDDLVRGTLYMLAAQEVEAIDAAAPEWREYSETWTTRANGE